MVCARAVIVIVRQDHNIGIPEVRRYAIRPVFCAHGVACRGRANLDERINAFLAFGNENSLFLRYSLDKLWQSIRYLANTFDFVDVTFRCLVALTVGFNRFPIRGCFAVFKTANLEKFLAGFIDVGPCLNSAPLPRIQALFFEPEVFERIARGVIGNIGFAVIAAIRLFEAVVFEPLKRTAMIGAADLALNEFECAAAFLAS
jgi:hypothetical protein